MRKSTQVLNTSEQLLNSEQSRLDRIATYSSLWTRLMLHTQLHAEMIAPKPTSTVEGERKQTHRHNWSNKWFWQRLSCISHASRPLTGVHVNQHRPLEWRCQYTVRTPSYTTNVKKDNGTEIPADMSHPTIQRLYGTIEGPVSTGRTLVIVQTTLFLTGTIITYPNPFIRYAW